MTDAFGSLHNVSNNTAYSKATEPELATEAGEQSIWFNHS